VHFVGNIAVNWLWHYFWELYVLCLIHDVILIMHVILWHVVLHWFLNVVNWRFLRVYCLHNLGKVISCHAVICCAAGMDQWLPQEMSRYCWTGVREIRTTQSAQLAAAWNRATCLTPNIPDVNPNSLGCWTMHLSHSSVCCYFVSDCCMKFTIGCIVRTTD